MRALLLLRSRRARTRRTCRWPGSVAAGRLDDGSDHRARWHAAARASLGADRRHAAWHRAARPRRIADRRHAARPRRSTAGARARPTHRQRRARDHARAQGLLGTLRGARVALGGGRILGLRVRSAWTRTVGGSARRAVGVDRLRRRSRCVSAHRRAARAGQAGVPVRSLDGRCDRSAHRRDPPAQARRVDPVGTRARDRCAATADRRDAADRGAESRARRRSSCRTRISRRILRSRRRWKPTSWSRSRPVQRAPRPVWSTACARSGPTSIS